MTGPKFLKFTDCDGKTRRVYCVSLKNRAAFSDAYQIMWNRLKSLPPELSLEEAYDTDDEFAELCEYTLSLGGVDPKWVDLNIMHWLLFPQPHPETPGQVRRGELLELNFPETPVANQHPGKQATYADVAAILWKMTDSLEEAYRLVSDMPADELIAMMESRSEMEIESNPELKKEKIKREASKRLLEDGFDEELIEIDMPISRG